MTELLQEVSPSQIVMFIILLCLAFKEVIDFIDWFKGKISKRDETIKEKQDEKESLEERVETLEQKYDGHTEVLNNIAGNVDLLILSDRDAIKAYITSEHHRLCYEKHWVDDYTLDCLERRYGHYVDEHGNSFIEQLMNEIRALPKQSFTEEEEQGE